MSTARPRSPHSAVALLTLLALALTLGPLACGGDDGPDLPTAPPPPPEDPTPPPPPPPSFDIVGDTILGLDLSNRLLVFGSESLDQVAFATIRGVTLLHRIVAIDVRPSDGRLYGVGNDSRVYLIDPARASATPVGTERFSPRISLFFDTHFGMAFDPETDRIRLVSAESGVNWSIDADDGTALQGKSVRYAEGDIHEGSTPRIAGIAYEPPGGAASPKAAAGARAFGLDCEKLLYAMDADLATLIGTCDPDELDWESIFEFEFVFARCGEVTFDDEGNLFAIMLEGVRGINRLGKVNPETGDIEWTGEVPHDSPVQSIVYNVGKLLTGGLAVDRDVRAPLTAYNAEPSAASGPPTGLAACRSAAGGGA